MRSVLAGLLLTLACAPSPAPMVIEAPDKVRQALSAVTELSGAAQLVPKGGTPGEEVKLTTAGDGVSFSGFLPATAGEYTLEVVFRGRPSAGGAQLFLGRLASDGFTVLEGSVATPTFSTPLDPIGRPGDRGDEDGDGLGALDEILFGTDLALADSDGDGLRDGQDCDPSNAGRTFAIVSGGSIEDCDGDRAIRPDLGYRAGGDDCDDRDPLVRPGGDDSDCSDGVDRDCNPATCPIDDSEPPVISQITPPAGSELGCHSRISATLTDNSTVTAATVTLDPDGATPRTAMMTGVGQRRYRTGPLNDVPIGARPSATGTLEVELAAVDVRSLRTEARATYGLRLEVPSVSRFLPATLGLVSAPFMVTVESSAPGGVRSVRLLTMPRTQAGAYLREQAVEVGATSGATLTVMVDPVRLGNGEHILVPVVEDIIGNRLQPEAVVAPIALNGEITVQSDYGCRDLPVTPTIPVRVVTVGGDQYRPTKMSEHLAEARSLAAGVDRAAAFVKVIGYGLRPDGRIALDDATSFSKRWEYGFYNPSNQRWITVTWFTPAFATQNPVVNPNAGNVVEELPLLGPDTLVDSDLVADAYGAAMSCGTLTGHDDDTIIYHRVDAADSVYVSAMDLSWVGTPHLPITEVASCQ